MTSKCNRMEEKQNLVSCIMPTYNRRQFVPNAIEYFLKQDYPNKELIIIDDGTDRIEDLIPSRENIRYYPLKNKVPLGTKLNMGCEYAHGNIIANWDDDDWYAPWRLSYQLKAMQDEEVELCGINNLLYYDLIHKRGFNYIYPSNQKVWLIGSSQCYRKTLWQRNKFADINVGLDGLFVWATPAEKIKVLENSSFSVHMIHHKNVSPKKTTGNWWHTFPLENIQKVIGKDWSNYANGAGNSLIKTRGIKIAPVSIQKKKYDKPIQNVFACLVHENEDCILDLVRNLHYKNPDSHILLYNGGTDPGLVSDPKRYEQYGATWHPSPTPQKHGYLHGFALDCMAFAFANYSFDTMTIVDSDQLCLRSGYSNYLTAYLNENPDTGLFSSNPQRILPDNISNHVALQAYKELALWQPLLDSFPDGRNKFVYWTFWPSTVFTSNAIRDLLKLFKENKILQHIMSKTQIWATEEVIFPTLVRLLGYEIAANPCSYDFVKYKKSFTQKEIQCAIDKDDVFWIHPIPRQYNFVMRKQIRLLNNHYTPLDRVDTKQNHSPVFSTLDILKRIEKIEGWLDPVEADLLISATHKACIDLSAPNTIVEIGSFKGKSTVVLGNVIKSFYPKARIFAIDPHQGVVGSTDKGLQQLPASLENFKQNILNEKLTEVVELIQDYSFNVEWESPISLLFIDGLHDYGNVSKDFYHFSKWIRKGGYIAFHDYAYYYPGVMTFVDELLSTGSYRKIQLAMSLMVIQKL